MVLTFVCWVATQGQGTAQSSWGIPDCGILALIRAAVAAGAISPAFEFRALKVPTLNGETLWDCQTCWIQQRGGQIGVTLPHPEKAVKSRPQEYVEKVCPAKPAKPAFSNRAGTLPFPDSESVSGFQRSIPVTDAYHRDMPTAYQKLLAATLRHLEELRARGIRHVPVTPATLEALRTPVRPHAVTSPARSGPPARTAPSRPAASARPSPAPTPIAPQPEKAMPDPTPKTDSAPADREAALAALAQQVAGCLNCPHLAASRRNTVFGAGTASAALMFVGEAPGADEDARGEPFVGRAGQLLTKIIQTMGLQRSEVYIANILKCRPDTPGQRSGNRKPTPSEMVTCLPYLEEQIRIIQPQVLVALGMTAVEGLLGKQAAGTSLGRLRGNWLEFRGTPLMPTYHPAYLLRNQSITEKRKVWEDMLMVMERLGLPISAKQRQFFLKK
jgi:DNA polymerase